jgi:hypothetical protein
VHNTFIFKYLQQKRISFSHDTTINIRIYRLKNSTQLQIWKKTIHLIHLWEWKGQKVSAF